MIMFKNYAKIIFYFYLYFHEILKGFKMRKLILSSLVLLFPIASFADKPFDRYDKTTWSKFVDSGLPIVNDSDEVKKLMVLEGLRFSVLECGFQAYKIKAPYCSFEMSKSDENNISGYYVTEHIRNENGKKIIRTTRMDIGSCQSINSYYVFLSDGRIIRTDYLDGAEYVFNTEIADFYE